MPRHAQIPGEIKTAVDALLRPYGYTLDALMGKAPAVQKIPQFLSASEVSQRLGCSKRCILQLVQKGCFPAYKTSASVYGGKILIPMESVMRYVESLTPWIPSPTKTDTTQTEICSEICSDSPTP